MKNNNYFIIQGWMINELKLSGNDLMTYAIIYGFSQDGESEFTGSLSYLQSFLGVGSKNTAKASLTRLEEKGLIIKKENYINGVKFCKYSHNTTVLNGGAENAQAYQNLNTGIAKIDIGIAKSDMGGIANIDPNNKYSISNIINKRYGEKADKPPHTQKKFIKPSIEELTNFFKEKNFEKKLNWSAQKIEEKAEKFFNFYESKGWMVGKNKMKSWEAAVCGQWLTEKIKTNEKNHSTIGQTMVFDKL